MALGLFRATINFWLLSPEALDHIDHHEDRLHCPEVVVKAHEKDRNHLPAQSFLKLLELQPGSDRSFLASTWHHVPGRFWNRTEPQKPNRQEPNRHEPNRTVAANR